MSDIYTGPVIRKVALHINYRYRFVSPYFMINFTEMDRGLATIEIVGILLTSRHCCSATLTIIIAMKKRAFYLLRQNIIVCMRVSLCCREKYSWWKSSSILFCSLLDLITAYVIKSLCIFKKNKSSMYF